MKQLIMAFLLSTSSIVLAQEKFLALTVIPKSEGKSLKNFTVLVSCEEGVDFTLTSRKKKMIFYLSAGLDYKLVVTKNGYYQSNYQIDLTDVPKALYQDDFLSHQLDVELVPKSKQQPTIIHTYFYETRYGKLKNK